MPAYIDKFSGYRYYVNNNIETMKKILYLKDLGFSLDEIKNYNNEKGHGQRTTEGTGGQILGPDEKGRWRRGFTNRGRILYR